MPHRPDWVGLDPTLAGLGPDWIPENESVSYSVLQLSPVLGGTLQLSPGLGGTLQLSPGLRGTLQISRGWEVSYSSPPGLG